MRALLARASPIASSSDFGKAAAIEAGIVASAKGLPTRRCKRISADSSSSSAFF
jgi:hypothetical protein